MDRKQAHRHLHSVPVAFVNPEPNRAREVWTAQGSCGVCDDSFLGKRRIWVIPDGV